jgi:NRAMP (natural resistance-associated macrophage protein)-like metal ion transporter
MDDRTKGRRDPVVEPSKPRLFNRLGPGLISGASDDDPAAIATWSQAGAKFGYTLAWMGLLCFPLMAAVQEISARVGRTTGNGLAGNIRRRYPPVVALGCIGLLLLANTVAIGADLGAMAEAVRLIVGGPQLLWVIAFGTFCVGLQVFLKYQRYVSILKWTTLSLLAYVASVMMAGVDWGAVAAGLIPRLVGGEDWARTLVAIFGVALSPYLLFWQSAQEVEDQQVKPEREPLVEAPRQAEAALERIRLDTVVGMAVAVLVGLAIMLTAAATLHQTGGEIATAADAAKALEPVAGSFATVLFALGILGTGLLAIPVLAGSAAYAVGEALRWPVGLSRRPLEAKAFYGTLAAATLVGCAVNLFEIDPIAALAFSATVNGFVAVPVLAVMTRIASDPQAMGRFTIGRTLRIVAWTGVAVMAVSATATLYGYVT